MENICNCCKKENEKNNFICSFCGFPLDMKIVYNDIGLPEIKE